MRREKPVYAFIDASNLFYGGVKSLGWRIDYKRLLKYLKYLLEKSKKITVLARSERTAKEIGGNTYSISSYV